MPVEVALPVSYNRSSYSNMPVPPLGTSKRRTSETSTYSSGSLASRRQIRQSLLERTASLSSSNGYSSTYTSSKCTSSYQSSYRPPPSGTGPLDSSSTKRMDTVYLENLRRGRFDVMSSTTPSSSRSSSLPPSRLLSRRESVSEICSSIKRDRDILLRGRDTVSPYRDYVREGSVKRELDSFQRESSVKRDMDSFRRGRSVEPVSYKDSYRKERESSISRFTNLNSSNLSSTQGRSRWSQSITDLTSDLDNMKSGDYNANSRYLDTLNSSIHDPYGTLPRRSRYRTESVEREERSLSRSRISESPIRSSRVSVSPTRTRVNESPTRTRVLESPSRYRLSESPSRTRLSDSLTRTLNNDEAAKNRLSEISSRTSSSEIASKTRLSESSPRSPSNDSTAKTRFSDSSARTSTNDSTVKTRLSEISARTSGNESSAKTRFNESSVRSPTTDISAKTRFGESSVRSPTNDISAKTRFSETSTRSPTNDIAAKTRFSDSSTRTSSNDVSGKPRSGESSSRTTLSNDSSSKPRLNEKSSWSNSNDSSSKSRSSDSSSRTLSNDSSAKPRLSETTQAVKKDSSAKPNLSETSRNLSNDSSAKPRASESSRNLSNDNSSKPRLSESSRNLSNDSSAKPHASESLTKSLSNDSSAKPCSSETSTRSFSNSSTKPHVNEISSRTLSNDSTTKPCETSTRNLSTDSTAKLRLSETSTQALSNDSSAKPRLSETAARTLSIDILAKPPLCESSSRAVNKDNLTKTPPISDKIHPRINDSATRSNINETPPRPNITDSSARPPRVSESPVRRVIESPLRAKVSESTVTTKYDINHNPTTTVTSPTTTLPKPPLSDYSSMNSISTPRRDRYSSYSSSTDDGYECKSSRSSLISNGKPEPATTLSSRNEYNTIKSSVSSKEVAGTVGLRNLGNTCFMNSVIQCLSNTQPVLDYCLRDSYISDLNTSHSSMKGALTKAFSSLIQSLWKDASSTCVSPHTFKQQIQKFAPRFMGYSQQDAQEFLRYLLQGLHEDVNRVTGKPKPIAGDIDENLSDSQKATEAWKRYLHLDDSKIVDLFVGQLKSTLKCTACGHSSVTFDPFWDLSLPIPKSFGTVSLQECLNLFTKEEVLDGDEKPTCSRCKKREKCMKSLTIQRFPKMLVIHLKRFSQERYRAKLTTLVDFPVNNLDLSKYAADKRGVQKATYNLYAVSNHSGTTYGGHYTAYCKHPKNGEWYDFNDTTVTPVTTTSDIIGSEAYLLFYEMIGASSRL